MLRELPGVKVLDLNSGARPTEETAMVQFYNRRAQMWWDAGELFANEEVHLLPDDKLKRQLCSIKYQTDSKGRIKVEGKDDIKRRLGGDSPDRADTLVMGLHALKFIPTTRHDFRRNVLVQEHQDSYGWKHTEALNA